MNRITAAAFFALASAAHAAPAFVTVDDLTVTPSNGAVGVAQNAALLVAAPSTFPLARFVAVRETAGGDVGLPFDVVRGSELGVITVTGVAAGEPVSVRLDPDEDGDGVADAGAAPRRISYTAGEAVIEGDLAAPTDVVTAPIDPCNPSARTVTATPPAGAVAMVLVPVVDGEERPGHAVLVDAGAGTVELFDFVEPGTPEPSYEVVALDAAGQESVVDLGASPVPDEASMVGCNSGGAAGTAPAFAALALLVIARRTQRRRPHQL